MIDGIRSIEEVSVKGKTVILRADLNSAVKTSMELAEPLKEEPKFKHTKLLKSPKLAAHAKTIRWLAANGAKIVVLSHQGREGRSDFIDLSNHCTILQRLTDLNVSFFKWNEDYLSAIKKMKEGEVVLLDNTRFLAFESKEKPAAEHAKEKTIKDLASVADFFVLDALSVAHRSHATVVGFTALLPSFAGPILVDELEALKKIESAKDNTVLVVGGLKPEDTLPVVEKMLSGKRASQVLLGGGLGELAIMAKGKSLGEKDAFLKENKVLDSLPEMKRVLEKFNGKICFPVDLAIRRKGQREEISLAELPINDMIYDVGEITMKNYCSIVSKADLVIFNGPLGKFESYQFAYGTRKMFETLCRSRAYSIIGGGDTLTAMVRLGFKEKEFNHVSLAGKALLQFLVGEELPGIIALAKNKQ
ncbi:MAG: phosphoglycerate kinase [Candidatus Diapherotrites archaeon]